ncbi:hypothetical protein [Bradyrhizobium iriomotense]|nr:hypothetical protein [Bradyrhizobium iriomotense]
MALAAFKWLDRRYSRRSLPFSQARATGRAPWGAEIEEISSANADGAGCDRQHVDGQSLGVEMKKASLTGAALQVMNS